MYSDKNFLLSTFVNLQHLSALHAEVHVHVHCTKIDKLIALSN